VSSHQSGELGQSKELFSRVSSRQSGELSESGELGQSNELFSLVSSRQSGELSESGELKSV